MPPPLTRCEANRGRPKLRLDQRGRLDTGDFNDDGGVNFSDLLTLSQNYGEPNFNLNSNFDSDWTHAKSLVPEPSCLSVLAFGLVMLRRKH